MAKDEVCCPKFNPEPWDGKVVEWKDKKFIKDRVKTFLYIPINFGGAMTRLMKKLDESGVKSSDLVVLSDHTSKWNMDLYLSVDSEIKGAENTTLSGKYLCKVYDGDFKDTGKWEVDFQNFAKEKGIKILKSYMWYTTCPKCAKKYGHNYVVFLAEIQ
ncbi:MAG: hydrolase [Candidatus Berkelbacteria bacterium]